MFSMCAVLTTACALLQCGVHWAVLQHGALFIARPLQLAATRLHIELLHDVQDGVRYVPVGDCGQMTRNCEGRGSGQGGARLAWHLATLAVCMYVVMGLRLNAYLAYQHDTDMRGAALQCLLLGCAMGDEVDGWWMICYC